MTWPRELKTMARDAIAVAAIAVLTVQALRRWCGDRYLVDSGSMQPVLYGDPNAGDVVFVDKLASAEARRRHDLVVVEHPDKPGQQLVKRIAARGDDIDACCINIDINGDIWLGPDAQHLHRETKDPLLARSMRVRWASFQPGVDSKLLDLRAGVVEGGVLRLPPVSASALDTRVIFSEKSRSQRRLDPARVVPTGFVGNGKPVDATYIDAMGARSAVGEDVGVTDCGMELEVLDPTELLCSIDSIAEALTFHWHPADGRLELWRNGETVDGKQLPPTPNGAHRIEYGLLDNRAFFVVDGRADAMFVFERRSEWLPGVEPGPGRGPRCFVYIGVVGDRPLCITSLHVFHDTFAYRERVAGLPGEPKPWPRTVEPGKWFLLGDSPFDSRDSRHFGPVTTSKFLGLPRLVLGPWPRCRWLCP
ncbi:MAG TPA: S26 family signal peptidase [Planctomycetota bacterium]|nr:S26 family signal peptidase [Planctomycetota bacterium]